MATQYAAGAGLALDMRNARTDREAHLELTAEQLQTALNSRVIIEQAKGFIAATRGVTPDEAFNLMRSYARSHNQTVQTIAGQVVNRRILI
jgi:AmiR/NasT family two-component response regulator